MHRLRVTVCATKQIPNCDPNFRQPLIVDVVGKSTRSSFAILNGGCLLRVGLFIILCVTLNLLLIFVLKNISET
jgi:hypothetical protein